MLESFDITYSVVQEYHKAENSKVSGTLEKLGSKCIIFYNFLLEHTVRSSLENSTFGNLVKFYLDISSLLLLEITSLVHS